MAEEKVRTITLSDEQKVRLVAHGHLVAEIVFSISQQNLEFSIYQRGEPHSNPILLFVDTELLGHSETDE